MTEFTQIISDKDYRKAIAIHYFGYKYTYINPVLGLILLLGLLTTLLVLPEMINKQAIFLFLLAAFLLLRPVLYVQNIFKSIKASRLYSNEMHIAITNDDKITTTSDGNLTSLNIADLYSYYNSKAFLFLYASQNQYLILDKRQMPAATLDHLQGILTSLNIKKR